MSIIVNRRIRVKESSIGIITRNLTNQAKIKVSVGQELSPEEIIGESLISSGFRSINLSHLLEVPPFDVKKYLQRPVGQRIYKGELLAFKPRSFLQPKKIITSPSDATIDSLDDVTGELKMSFLPKRVVTPSSVYGVVEEIDTATGQVMIKTEMVQIYGVIGSGKVREGNIIIIGDQANLTKALQVKRDYDGGILVTGGLIYKEALSASMALGVNGIVTGGINAKDFVGMSGGRIFNPQKETDVGLSVVVTEGFGSVPIGNDIFEKIKSFNGRFAIINGNRFELTLPTYDESCMMRIKKTQLPRLQKRAEIESVPDLEVVELLVGQMVRVVASSYMGQVGKIVAIDKSATTLPSGIKTYQVLMETKSRKIKVPFPNVEVI